MSIQQDIDTIHDYIGNAEMPTEMQNDAIRALQRLERQLDIVQGRWQPAETGSLGDGSHSLTWIPKLRHVVLYENGIDIGYFLPDGWAICQRAEGVAARWEPLENAVEDDRIQNIDGYGFVEALGDSLLVHQMYDTARVTLPPNVRLCQLVEGEPP